MVLMLTRGQTGVFMVEGIEEANKDRQRVTVREFERERERQT